MKTERRADIVSLEGLDVTEKAQASSPATPIAHRMESGINGGNDEDVTLALPE
jgi:hypothetical protein